MAAKRPPLQRKRWRAALALVLAPLLASALLGLVAYFTVFSTPKHGPSQHELFWAAAIGQLIYLEAFGLTIGWAFHHIAHARRWRKLSTYALGGCLIGEIAWTLALLATVAVPSFTYLNQENPKAARDMALTAATFGIVIAFLPALLCNCLFWLLRRPDKNRTEDVSAAFE